MVEPGYFRALGIPILAGRGFTAADDAGDGGVVVSREVARGLWPGRDALGRRLSFRHGQWVEVVGVGGEVVDRSLETAGRPTLYSPFAGATYGSHSAWTMEVMIRTAGEPEDWLAAVRAQIAALDPDPPIARVSVMSEVIRESTAKRRFSLLLLGGFGLLALALAAVGLYGVLAFKVAHEIHDFGIRMALGAGRRDIFRLVIRRGMALVGGGLALGLILSWALGPWIESLLYAVTATDAASFAIASAMLAVGALAACLVPAFRATRIDPLVALRYE